MESVSNQFTGHARELPPRRPLALGSSRDRLPYRSCLYAITAIPYGVGTSCVGIMAGTNPARPSRTATGGRMHCERRLVNRLGPGTSKIFYTYFHRFAMFHQIKTTYGVSTSPEVRNTNPDIQQIQEQGTTLGQQHGVSAYRHVSISISDINSTYRNGRFLVTNGLRG
ncbi:hypothetical protein F5148DRAFT_233148 [Russula earlei]|uniref:Uncharacterized protein n=1 Tax=Russula earlei TaxID=71964 RepID=A0ACC0U5L7_9AGAM|nr:hypothetical protein F5148DRAFT_233148 [Russula earlei]